MAIEQIHDLKFLNREEIAELIAQSAADVTSSSSNLHSRMGGREWSQGRGKDT